MLLKGVLVQNNHYLRDQSLPHDDYYQEYEAKNFHLDILLERNIYKISTTLQTNNKILKSIIFFLFILNHLAQQYGFIICYYYDKYADQREQIIKSMKYMNDTPITKKALKTRGLQSSPQIWIQEKRNFDSSLWNVSNKLWIVENKAYDLSSYAQKHPGGQQWIKHTQGHDITEHFIVHHLNEEKARAVLQKYFVSDVSNPQKPRYTFEENGLYRQTKKRLLEEHSTSKMQNTSKSTKDGIFLLVVWLILFIMSAYFQSYALAMLSGMSIFPLLGVAHNFVHMKWHPFRYLYLLTGFTHKQWEKMHCISHHQYTNTLLDFEIQGLQPLAYYLRSKPQNGYALGILNELTTPLLLLLNIALKVVVIPITKFSLPNLYYAVCLIQIPAIFLFTGDWSLSLKLFIVMHMTLSIIFFKSTFLGHRTGMEWTDGDEEISDFAEHQIYSCTDIKTNDRSGLLSYILHAGFNFHVIHHLFPTIDNHFLPTADKILVDESAKLGLKKNELTSVFKGIIDSQRHFFSRKQWKKNHIE